MTPIQKNGPACASLRLELSLNESAKAALSTIIAHSDGISLTSKADGGLLRMIARKFSNDNFLFQQISATTKGWVLLAPPQHGALVTIDLDGKQVIAAKDSFLASAASVEISEKSPELETERPTLKFSGYGALILSATGLIEPFILLAGQSVSIKAAHLIAYEDGTVLQKTDDMIKAVGPARLWVQTRLTSPALPQKGKSGNS